MPTRRPSPNAELGLPLPFPDVSGFTLQVDGVPQARDFNLSPLTMHMRTILSLICLAVVAAGCDPQAPAMKRVVSYDLIDEHYLKEVFVPSYAGPSSKSTLSNSVIQLDMHLAEFRDFMHQVETGSIPVKQGFKQDWRSFVIKDGAWTFAGYTGPEGLVVDFQKHKNQDPFPLVYGFRISTNGYILWATTIKDGFQFDEHGRVQQYWHK
jgi:hypothetical protein